MLVAVDVGQTNDDDRTLWWTHNGARSRRRVGRKSGKYGRFFGQPRAASRNSCHRPLDCLCATHKPGPLQTTSARSESAAFSRSFVEEPTIAKMDDANASRESVAIPLAFALSVAAAVAYAILWSLLKGSSGCGPPGRSASGRAFSAAPLVLPILAAAVLIAVGTKLVWRRRAVVGALLTTVGTTAVLEVLVFLLEFGSHHCGE